MVNLLLSRLISSMISIRGEVGSSSLLMGLLGLVQQWTTECLERTITTTFTYLSTLQQKFYHKQIVRTSRFGSKWVITNLIGKVLNGFALQPLLTELILKIPPATLLKVTNQLTLTMLHTIQLCSLKILSSLVLWKYQIHLMIE